MDYVRKKISEMSFSLLSPEKIKKMSVAKIVTPELYDIDGYPVDGGLMDLRLGAIDPGVRCRTCGGRLKECLGHPGSIDLARSIVHLKYVPIIELCLRSFCNDCSRLMISDKDLDKYATQGQRVKRAKDSKKCPHCNVSQERVKLDKPTTFYRGKTRIFPIEVRETLSNIPDEELKKAGINTKNLRPEWGILMMLLVPPVTVRPSIILESGERSEDDLTHKLSDIIRANQRLWENLNAGAPEVIIEDLWDLLQFHITTFFDNTVSRVPPARHRSGQPLKTITERIKGKEGRIRKNLAGKRVNYSGRTVISPDPSIEINEVGVPYEIVKVVTVAETANDLNLEKLKGLVQNGAKYPGANYVIRPDGKRKKITEELKEEIISEMSVGYKVERHLQNGDIVLFNRHPSLHKGSLMAHYIKVLPGRTFRLHPAVATPYNADFDGDEMNIHSPQTEEARSEAKILLEVKKNLISPKNNTNWIGCIADAITGCYLLGENEFTREEANQIAYKSGVDYQFSKKTVSGKEVFSKIIPKLNYSDGNIKIENGEITEGIINKDLFGDEDGELIKVIDKHYGRTAAVDAIKKAFNLGRNYLTEEGITISLDDLDVDQKVIDMSEEIVRKAEEKTKEIIKDYDDGTLELIQGKTMEESRENKILRVLNEIRTKIGEIVKREFPAKNPVTYMMRSGGGGSVLNITQMACVVGQQDLGGKRIDIGYIDRTLSFFKKGDLSPRSKGFIRSPFIKGLRPDEFFFGAMTGRATLMDTALRTPRSGYLYRRLANALQDLRREYDGTVRDSNNNIIQFVYGDDGKDVSRLHLNKDVEAGEAIGVITSQSFGEPSTQMVLRTFHFAGVTEMQVTQGLPRLIEIFDARKKPSSPKMEIYLKKEFNNEKDSTTVAEKIREVTVNDIASEIDLDFSNKRIEIKIDKEGLRQSHMALKKVVEILNELGFKAKEKSDSIIIDTEEESFKGVYQVKEKVRKCIISGIKGIKQVIIVRVGSDYVVMTLGTNLKKVLEMKEINPEKLVSNDLHEVAGVFGIEAARQLIIDEIQDVLNSQGLNIDKRHLKLISDAMTNTGEVKGVTRIGIIAQKSSILARATFETPVKQFVNATIKGNKDYLTSVVENVILNQPVPVGTGLPGLLVKVIGPLVKKDSEKKTAKTEVVEEVNK
ncbi:MAG: DNA-directed RNA polymerase subunit A' [Nanoarchaeota archaeon]|nr:DNA-directed RNA polymerase subunit A' [Nanoarchaeota archaeon]MBU2459058.1 DNA-directed RNA polymerase subunit A' [Nanoarchaeota archaeon]